MECFECGSTFVMFLKLILLTFFFVYPVMFQHGNGFLLPAVRLWHKMNLEFCADLHELSRQSNIPTYIHRHFSLMFEKVAVLCELLFASLPSHEHLTFTNKYYCRCRHWKKSFQQLQNTPWRTAETHWWQTKHHDEGCCRFIASAEIIKTSYK